MNEALLIASAVADIGLVMVAFSRRRSWLCATIVLNLLLVSVLGQKVISVWGFATNVGNVFYASVFFAIYLLLEHDTRDHVFRALSIGVMSVVAFTVLLLLVLGMQSHPATTAVSDMMEAVFRNAPRFALASLAGFVVSQGINVTLYLSSVEEPTQMHWWLRLLVVMMVAQLIDSIIFFTIAFWGIVTPSIVIESMTVGYMIKVIIGAATIPLIHWSKTANHAHSI